MNNNRALGLLFICIYLNLGVVGLSEADSLASDVVDVAVGSDPGVSEDPGRSESTTSHGEEGKGTLKK